VIGPYYITSDWRRRAAWGSPCDVPDFGVVTIDGRTLTVHSAAVEAFTVFDVIRAHHGYRLTGTDTGFYSCRHMQHDPSKPWSFHAWALALDINWLENPAGNKLVTDLPPRMVTDLLAVRTVSGARVFRWGADWDWDGQWTDHNYVDAMHWEMVAHPLDIATGIAAWSLSPPERNTDTMSLLGFNIGPTDAASVGGAEGDPTGDKAESLQRGLMLRGYDLPRWGADRFVGNESRTAFAAWQADHGITEPGVMGPHSDAIWVWQPGSVADVDLTGLVTASDLGAMMDAHAGNPDAHHA
jgi:hypothetical protein